jgi:hypothetical protein
MSALSSFQSIVLEGSIWALLFAVFVENGTNKAFKRYLQRIGVYDILAKEKSTMYGEHQAEEVVLVSGTGAEHVFAGTLILVGGLIGSPALVRSGLLCEWGWEAKDLCNLSTNTGPYRSNTVSDKVKASFRFHHLPGLLSAPALIIYGMHANVHVQRIGLMMIWGGGIGLLANLFRIVNMHLPGRPSKLVQSFAAFELFGTFAFVRFLLFPLEVASLLNDLIAMDCTAIAGIVALGFLMMSRFNVVVFRIKYNKYTASKPADSKQEDVAVQDSPAKKHQVSEAAQEMKKKVDASIRSLPMLHHASSSMHVLKRQSSSASGSSLRQ